MTMDKLSGTPDGLASASLTIQGQIKENFGTHAWTHTKLTRADGACIYELWKHGKRIAAGTLLELYWEGLDYV